MLQVQKEVPIDLLLGTDVLGKLGFGLVQQEGERRVTNLLESPKKETGAQDTGTPVAVVKLLHATRLPARHSKLIRVEIADDKRVAGDTTLFEPEVQTLKRKGLAMADAVVGFGVGGEVTLVMENHGTSPVQLPEGELLGSLHPATIVDKHSQSVEGRS